ncbi:hypothetical protein HO173_012726 [Letharia columbiana]|uniref:Uncharacterized protein n=1 Tax=Letharia columbiana TaxID=112416 RepID=A0A8H6FED5_9LECA|nr:uncharacterized protein HO173_012726 [Letharia columbiana]KAF6225397.1 hypothetical protein HO173_012726 [Letharia columbiana]
MNDSTPVESRTKEPFEMDDQSFVGSDTYQADFDAGAQFESPARSASGRWQTINSSNTMDLERHLSASSVSRDVRASSVSNQRYDDNDRPDSTNMVSTQSEGQSYENDRTIMNSDRVLDSREQMESATLTPGRSPSQAFGNNGNHSNLESRSDLSERSQSGNTMSTPFLDPGLMDPHASRGSDHRYGTSEPQEPANLMPAANINHKYDNVRTSSSSDQRRGSSERLDSVHLVSPSGIERRRRSPSPRPKVSAETKARWAMLKQLAGVSQPRDVEEEDRNEGRDEETRTTEVDSRIREESNAHDSSQTGDHVDDASIERYLQKLQGDPHIDSRGLREGLSRMQSYKGSNSQQDQHSAHESHFEGNTYSGARRPSEDIRNSGMENEVRGAEQDARDKLNKGKGEAEKALRGREAGSRGDGHALGAGLEGAGRRAEGELRSAGRDARDSLQKDKNGFERDVQRDTSMADAEVHKLGGQTAREFRRGEHGLEAGLEGAAHAAEGLLPPMNVLQDLRQGEHDLMGDVHKAENAFSRTGLGQEVRKGEHDLIGEVHKLEQEFPHIGLGQEFRKGEQNLMGDIHKIENEVANTGLGQEIRKGENHLVDEFHKLEHELPHLGLGQDLRRGEHDLKQSLNEAADHLRRDEHALGKGAEAVGRSVEHGLENIGRFAVDGVAIAGGLGVMPFDHAESGKSAPSPRPNVLQPGHGMINPNGQQMPRNTHQPGAGGPHPLGAPGAHPALNVQRLNQAPANHQNRPSIVEPPHHPLAPQTPQRGHNRGPSGSQHPHLSPSSSPTRVPSPGPGMNKITPGRTPSPSPGNNQRSQMPVRKPVLPPRPQGAPQHPSQPQHPQGAPQHPSQPQHPQGAPQHPPQPPHPQGAAQHPSQPQHPQGAPQHPPQPQHPQGAPQHPPQPQHPQGAPQHPPQPQHPQGAPQHPPQPQISQGAQPHPTRTPQQRQPPNAIPQHPPPQHPLSTPQHPQGGRQQGQPPNAMSQHPQTPHPQGESQQRQPASAMPQPPPPPHPQGAPKQRSQSPTPPHPQVSDPQQRFVNANPHPQPQHSRGTPQPILPKDRRDGEAQRQEAMGNSNVQQARQAMPGAAIGSHPGRTQPLSNERPESECKTDEQEPRASIMQERRRRAAESQRRMAERQEQQTGHDCRHEDHDADSCPHQTERHSTTEHAEESHSISGPQSMLNMFKARADAAIEASGDYPSFTDQMVQLLCKMAQDAMPEIERRLAQNQRQDCS